MYRPLHPRMVNNVYRNHTPYGNKWKPQHTSIQFQWRNRGSRPFGPTDIESKKSEEHWCETCDRGFPTLELLDKHKQQHQKCNIDGCQFVAHPKVITKHIQMQHSSGLYKKISNLNNPEEIQKWREERKKKYPTISNIEKKAAECKEKIERGEKMAIRNENCNNRNRSTGGGGYKRKHNADKGNQKQTPMKLKKLNDSTNTKLKDTKTHPPSKKTPKTLPVTEQKNKLKPFSGIMNIEFDEKEDISDTLECNHLIEDDDYGVDLKEHPINQIPVVMCGALSSLICDYGSSDEDITNVNETQNVTVNVANHNKEVRKSQVLDTITNLPQLDTHPTNDNEVKNNSDDDSGPEEMKVIKNVKETNQSIQFEKPTPVQKNIVCRNRLRQNYKPKQKIPSTLLQKLLCKEIRKERNIVLQCIRYIKKNNYFE